MPSDEIIDLQSNDDNEGENQTVNQDLPFLDEWVNQDMKWNKMNQWQSYLIASRQSYFLDRQQTLGSEYFSNTSSWDIVFEREWNIIAERMNSGIGIDEEVLSIFGKDFFKDKEELLQEYDDYFQELKKVDLGENSNLLIYTFEDFLMLSNQGIFRDEIFLLDPERKWRKKVEKVVRSYGYNTIERINIEGENYLVVTR
jgi:hypothetical protein